jgi:hypothetical protein
MDSVEISINRDNKITKINYIIAKKFNNYDDYHHNLVRHYLILKNSRGYDLQQMILLLEEDHFSTLEEIITYIKKK